MQKRLCQKKILHTKVMADVVLLVWITPDCISYSTVSCVAFLCSANIKSCTLCVCLCVRLVDPVREATPTIPNAWNRLKHDNERRMLPFVEYALYTRVSISCETSILCIIAMSILCRNLPTLLQDSC